MQSSRLNQEEIDNLNILITNSEIEFVIKKKINTGKTGQPLVKE